MNIRIYPFLINLDKLDIIKGGIVMSLKEKLSIILVTSPIVSHPSIELIGKVVSSFNLVDHLSTCSLVIGKRYVKLTSITLS